MKKLISFSIAFILFIFTCFSWNIYIKHSISNKKQELIYYNTDNRNFCIPALKIVLTEDAVPVLGSSELFAEDEVAYPPFLFHQGQSDFNMVLIGRSYMQSLHHAINLGAISDMLSYKKVVLILSPQWFTASHLSSEMYSSRFSERLYVDFLKNSKISYETKNKITKRVKELLKADIKQQERIFNYEKTYLNCSLNPISHIELILYDTFMEMKQSYSLKKEIKSLKNSDEKTILVDTINFDLLMKKAEETGKKECTNNNLFIKNSYYDAHIKEVIDNKKDTELNASYLESPEYSDLCLFLTVCKETGISSLIVNIPVNGYWYDWTGFPKENREEYYQNIRNICNEYQVQIADFSDKEYEAYFLKDIMHLGWKGWVYLDEAVYKFYKQDM